MKLTFLFLILCPLASAATCNLPAGTYTLSTSAASWSCGHVPTNLDTATIAAGVTLTVNSAWGPGNLTVNGTIGSHVTFIGSSGSIAINPGGNGDFTYFDVTGLGSSTVAAIRCDIYVTCSFTHGTITASGKLDLGQNTAYSNSVTRVNDMVFSGGLNAHDLDVLTYYLYPIGSGVREIKRSIFSKGVYAGGYMLDFSLEDNYLGNDLYNTGDQATASFRHNLLVRTGLMSQEFPIPGDITDSIMLWLTSAGNPHGLGFAAVPNRTIDGLVAEATTAAGDGDMTLHGTAPSGVDTVKNSLFLCSATGLDSGTGNTATYSSTHLVFDHNTWCGGGNQGIVQQENGAQTIDSMRSNIAWRKDPANTAYKYAQYGDTTADTCILCDYNNAFNVALGSDNGYHAVFSSTPGAHDINNVYPQFVDRTRTLMTFDTAYLHQAAGTPWVTSHSYSVGDLVSYTDATYWWGAAVNFRCIRAHTSSSGDKPTASGWESTWEPASLYQIRQAMIAGTTYTDSAIGCAPCTPIMAAWSWLRAGYAPTDPALRNAGHDGADIGAVPWVSASTEPYVTNGNNAGGSTIKVDFPGKFALEFGTGDGNYGGTDYHGLTGFWDLKNDPGKLYNLAGINTGLMEWQWGLNNSGGGTRIVEYKASPGPVAVIEQNSVRVKLRYHYVARSQGYDPSGIDCCVTVDEYFTIYAPDKIYQTIKWSYSNADSHSPLAFTYLEQMPKVNWSRISKGPGTLGAFAAAGGACYGSYHDATPSPWQWMYENPNGTNLSKTYSLFSSTSAVSDLPANNCNGSGNPGAATPGDIAVCTNANCSPSGISSHVTIKSNFLYLADPSEVTSYPGGYPQYFTGLRGSLVYANPTLATGTNMVVKHAAMFAGDNGITTEAAALAYTAEYRTPPTLTMSVGTSSGFDYEAGSNLLIAGATGVDFTAGAAAHYPVFDIAGWTWTVPTRISVGGSTKTIGTDYHAAIVTGHLLVQVLSDTPTSTHFIIIHGPVLTPSTPPTVSVSGTTHITADRASTWSLLSGSSGSLVADGDNLGAVYTAPSVITVPHKVYGCQMGPVDSVFTTRIDTLPVDSMSIPWIVGVSDHGTQHLNLAGLTSVNIVDNSTPTTALKFYYPNQDVACPGGPTDTSFPLPPMESIITQGGVHSTINADKYTFMVNKETCQISEMYGIYNLTGTTTNPGAPNCKGSSGWAYTSTNPLLPAYNVNASGNEMLHLVPQLEDFREAVRTGSNVLPNMLRFTIGNDKHSIQTRWPATTASSLGCDIGSPPVSGVCFTSLPRPPFGSVWRLKSTYSMAGCLTGVYDATVINTLKLHGMLLADGSSIFGVDVSSDTARDPDFQTTAQNFAGCGPQFTDFEIVDVTSRRNSDAISSVKPDSGYGAPPLFAVVVAEDLSVPGSTTRLNIGHRGVSVGTPDPLLQMQAGGPPHQLTSWVSGSANQTVTWTMSPAQGTITSGGIYTPPASIGTLTRVVLTCTAAAASSATTKVDIWLYPSGIIRNVFGRATDYVDGTTGHTYWRDIGAEWGADQGNWTDMTNMGVGWPGTNPDEGAYKFRRYAFSDIWHRQWILPNGFYKITWLFAYNATPTPGLLLVNFTGQGARIASSVDIGALESFTAFNPASYSVLHVHVTDHTLKVGQQSLYDPGAGISIPSISGFIIEPEVTAGNTTISGSFSATGSVSIR